MVKPLFWILACIVMLNGCASRSVSLYEELGGQAKINEIVENFVYEIEYNDTILPYFADTDIDRFIEKFAEQLCVFSGGPCSYSGDTMKQVHGGMNITEADFNLTVDLFINAMNKANVPHTLQNKLIARMTHTRKQMLYL
ncbi:group I truncated hemoglobin [Alteromonas lipolytica]|nr:group 1 truncated hemoglobin [Alteromonas lipolytica]GGF72821.1 cyanoglobin [Alteromonas lipolytica]